MSADLSTLYIKVDSSGVVTASKNLDELTGKSIKAEKTTTTATASMAKSWIDVKTVVDTVMTIIKQSVQSFMEAEKAELKMAMALKNQGEYSRAVIEDLKDYAAQIQRTTVIEDDLALSVMATFKTFGMSNDEMKRAMKVAADMSAHTGKSIKDTAQAVVLAYAGQASGLRQYGVVIKEGTAKAGVFNMAMLQLEQRYGESAQAQLLTYSGQWAKIKNQWSDIAEFLGLVLLKTLQSINVAVGLTAVAFLSMGSKVLQMLEWLTKPLFKILEGVGWVADRLGATNVSLVMEGITTSIDNARGSVLQTKQEVLDWTSANYDNLESFNKIDEAVSKMKPGQRTKPELGDTTGGSNQVNKYNEQILEATRKAYSEIDMIGKSQYEKEIERIKLEAEEYKKHGVSKVNIAKYVAAQAELVNKKAQEEMKAALKEMNYDNAINAMLDEINSGSALSSENIKHMEDYASMMKDVQDEMLSEHDRAIQAALEKEKERYRILDELMKTDMGNYINYEDEKAKITAAKNQELEKLDENYKKETVSNIVNIFDTASQMYDKDSQAYNRLQDLKKVALTAEMALEAQKNAALLANMLAANAAYATAMAKKAAGLTLTATEAVLTQGTGEPYSAFARMAAMTAIVVSLLGAVGISFTGKGGGASTSAQKSTSTALGSEEPSESVSKSYDLLKDIYDVENNKLTGIYNEVKDLNTNISGVVGSIFKSGGLSTEGMNINLNTIYSQSYNNQKKFQSFMAGDWASQFQSYITVFSDKMTQFDFMNKFANGLNEKIATPIYNAIMGGKTSRKVTQQGFSFGEYSYGDTLDVQNWVKVKTTTDGGWFHSDKTRYNEYYSALTDEQKEIGRQFDLIYSNISGSLVELAKGLGTDVSAAENYVFQAATLNLKGMTAEEMTTAISNFFSTQSDKAAEALFGSMLGKYQKVGEGMYETSVRIFTDMQTIQHWTDKVGISFNGTTEELIDFDEQLINAAGDLDTLTGHFQKFFESFYTEEEQQAYTTQTLTENLKQYNLTMPASREEWRNTVNSFYGKDADTYAALLSYSDMMDQYFDAIEDTNDKLKTALQEALDLAKTNLEAAFSAEKERINDLYNQQLKKLQDNLSAITETVNKLRSARESMNLVDKQTEQITFLRSKQALMKGVWNDDILKSVTSISPEQYSTREAYLKDYHKIYNQLAALESDATAKQTDAQKQIDILTKTHDDQIAVLDKQYNALVGIDDSVLSVADAIAAYHKAYSAVNNITYVKGPNCPTYAEGGDASGWGIAGEAGAELINFGTSSRVYSNADTKAIFDSGGIIGAINGLSARVDRQAKDNRAFQNTVSSQLSRFDSQGIKERTA